MTPRFISLAVFLGGSVLIPHVHAAIPVHSQQATGAAEAAGLKASPAVQKMLDEASRLSETKQPLDLLKVADQALEASKQASDLIGAALAQQARAKALQDLGRTDEASVAWQEAAQVWAVLGDTPGQITTLVQAGLLRISGNKNDAETLFARALSIGKSETQRPAAVAQALHDSGVALEAQAQDQTAWDYLGAALAIMEKETPESLKLVEALNDLAKLALHRSFKNPESADPKITSLVKDYSTRAAEMGQRLNSDSSMVVESLHTLALYEHFISESYAQAREHYLAALRIQRKLLPGGSVEEAGILNDLGVLEDSQTNFGASREYLEQAVLLGERLAPASEQFGESLENLAILEQDEGDLSSARDHLRRALGIKEEIHGNVAPTILNLGALSLDQYDFASAHDYSEKALALFLEPRPNTKPNTHGVAFALGNLSETFYRQGDFKSALEYRRRSIAILESQSAGSLAMAEDLSGMGDILRAQGQLTEAAEYYRRAMEMQEKVAPESLHVSQSLAALAKVARAQHELGVAMAYDQHALELGQKTCPNFLCVGAILNDLGELAYEQADLTGSESYLRRAVDVREKSLGPMHPALAHSLNALALTVTALGRTEEAFEYSLRAERIGAEHLRMSVRTLPERQALAYEDIRASGLDLALTIAAGPASTPTVRGEAFDAVIRSRALVFDELATRHRAAYGSGDPAVIKLSGRLLSARTRLATLVFRGMGDLKPETYRNLLEDARRQEEEAQRALAEKSFAFRQDRARTQLGMKEIAASLPQGSALVAFVRFARHSLQKRGISSVVPEPVPSYAAFVLRAGAREPEFVQLGTARQVESVVAAWRHANARQAEVTYVGATMGEDSDRRLGAALRRRIWDPLLPVLYNVREVFIVPDAALHLVSLASLPVSSSKYLIETGPLIYYLSTERDLVPAESIHGEGLLVVGNPAFDQVGKVIIASNEEPIPTGAMNDTAVTLLRGSRSACGMFQTLRFAPLPSSQKEAEKIAAVWKRTTAGEGAQTEIGSTGQWRGGQLMSVTGAEASAEAFEQYAPGKRVLHLATHGFFLEGGCESAVQRRSDVNTWDETLLPTTAENPLLLSGLAFAGANRRASGKPDESDGILTAEEIAGIDLHGVDWAVLSACDTGVGEIKIGEGVFGLRRAFQIAGAKTVIMSLWPVDDETTQQWMSTLYREHFLNGKDIGDSVRTASIQALRQRRAKHQSTHPFYWGAFIAAGDWH